MAQPTKIIVGLGNPGADYSFNRHNVGFMLVDFLAESEKTGSWQKKFKALISSAKIGTFETLLLKPQTYMNLSGEAVGEALRYYKLTPADVIVAHDDIDLQSGQIKVKQGGGHGGHNGLKSIDAHIGKDYWRLRIGVGHPGDRDAVTDHVLGNFSKTDRTWLEPLFEKMPSTLPYLLEGKVSSFLETLPRTQKAIEK